MIEQPIRHGLKGNSNQFEALPDNEAKAIYSNNAVKSEVLVPMLLRRHEDSDFKFQLFIPAGEKLKFKIQGLKSEMPINFAKRFFDVVM